MNLFRTSTLSLWARLCHLCLLNTAPLHKSCWYWKLGTVDDSAHLHPNIHQGYLWQYFVNVLRIKMILFSLPGFSWVFTCSIISDDVIVILKSRGYNRINILKNENYGMFVFVVLNNKYSTTQKFCFANTFYHTYKFKVHVSLSMQKLPCKN